MNKKLNTLVYMLVATIVNLILMAILYIAAFVAYALIIEASGIPADSPLVMILALVCFILPVVLAFFLYSRIVRFAMDHFQLESKLDPIFTPHRRSHRKNQEE